MNITNQLYNDIQQLRRTKGISIRKGVIYTQHDHFTVETQDRIGRVIRHAGYDIKQVPKLNLLGVKNEPYYNTEQEIMDLFPTFRHKLPNLITL